MCAIENWKRTIGRKINYIIVYISVALLIYVSVVIFIVAFVSPFIHFAVDDGDNSKCAQNANDLHIHIVIERSSLTLTVQCAKKRKRRRRRVCVCGQATANLLLSDLLYQLMWQSKQKNSKMQCKQCVHSIQRIITFGCKNIRMAHSYLWNKKNDVLLLLLIQLKPSRYQMECQFHPKNQTTIALSICGAKGSGQASNAEAQKNIVVVSEQHIVSREEHGKSWLHFRINFSYQSLMTGLRRVHSHQFAIKPLFLLFSCLRSFAEQSTAC